MPEEAGRQPSKGKAWAPMEMELKAMLSVKDHFLSHKKGTKVLHNLVVVHVLAYRELRCCLDAAKCGPWVLMSVLDDRQASVFTPSNTISLPVLSYLWGAGGGGGGAECSELVLC